MTDRSKHTIESAAVAYLGSLSAERRSRDEAAIQKFVRWCGRQRLLRDISPLDIDTFSSTATPVEGAALRGFLSDAYKKRIIPPGLASHVKGKKESTGPTRAGASNEEPIHVTAEGLESLKSELEELRKERVTVTEQMRKAAADKDFRENAPLQAAREQKSHIEGRIQEIEATLARATVAEKKTRCSTVGLHDSVRLIDLSTGTAVEYKLVDSQEANPAKGRISTASPIGHALLGRQPGEEFEFTAPAGTFRYRVERIEQEQSN